MNKLSITVILTLVVLTFIFAQLPVVNSSGKKSFTQEELITAIKVLSESAETTQDKSDEVVYKNAFELLKRKVNNKSEISIYDKFFTNLKNHYSTQRNSIFCSSIIENPWVGIKDGPNNYPASDFFRVLQEKLDKDNIKLEELTKIIERVKVQQLSLPGAVKQDYFILRKNSHNLILEPKIETLQPDNIVAPDLQNLE